MSAMVFSKLAALATAAWTRGVSGVFPNIRFFLVEWDVQPRDHGMGGFGVAAGDDVTAAVTAAAGVEPPTTIWLPSVVMATPCCANATVSCETASCRLLVRMPATAECRVKSEGCRYDSVIFESRAQRSSMVLRVPSIGDG